MNYIDLKRTLKTTEAMERFERLYGLTDSGFTYQMSRYTQLVKLHEDIFNNDSDLFVISSPGRSEIIGNHTDHNKGIVLAAAINLDTLACVSKREDDVVHLVSEGYAPVEINLSPLKPIKSEAGTTSALIRGVAARMKELGYVIGGFDATVTSDVLSGSGMSSSAAFEVLICAILDYLYNGFVIDSKARAKIAQYAENYFFMKPCGLMDQMASSTGGLVAIDFKNEETEVQPLHFSFAQKGYAMVVVNTGGSHDDLTQEYAAIPHEMREVAEFFHENNLRKVRKEQFMQEIPAIREKVGDRAVLRSLHFFNENERVLKAVDALMQENVDAFFNVIRESGLSSWTLLQNVTMADTLHQQLAVSLAVSNMLLDSKGASRIHGGGFAGTTLHFVSVELVPSFVQGMNRVFGENASFVVDVRQDGPAVVFG